MIGLPGCAVELGASKGRMASSSPFQARWVAAWPRPLQPTQSPHVIETLAVLVGNLSFSRGDCRTTEPLWSVAQRLWSCSTPLPPPVSHVDADDQIAQEVSSSPTAQRVRMAGILALLCRP